MELEHGIGTEPGGGQTVGLIDTGIDQAHPVFAGKTITETFLNSSVDEIGDRASHGTAVASVIVGRSLDPDFIANADPARGVAWGADVAMFAIPAGSAGSTYHPLSLTSPTSIDDRWAARITRLVEWSSGGRTLDFVNVSVGYPGIIEMYGEQTLRDSLGQMIEALAQEGTTDKTVFVWAGGNAHGKNCEVTAFDSTPDLCMSGKVNAKSVEILPGLPARIAELRGHVIAAVAVAPGSDYQIASFSNRCGMAAQWCIAAPGQSIRAAYFGPYIDPDTNEVVPGGRGVFSPSGTSVAAPMVTGALVVMKDYFRDELYNTDLVSRLMSTADKSGIFADADVYGQGLLDLVAATLYLVHSLSALC